MVRPLSMPSEGRIATLYIPERVSGRLLDEPGPGWLSRTLAHVGKEIGHLLIVSRWRKAGITALGFAIAGGRPNSTTLTMFRFGALTAC